MKGLEFPVRKVQFYYFFNAGTGIQLHGGVGFTWEYDIQLYFKRAKSSETFLGNGAYHRERLAQRLLDD